MKKYDPKIIESKWQKKWDEENIVKIDKDDTSKEKYYVLDMFPYPSGDGLHMGHAENYIPTDIIYRYKKMRGFNVLHPQGFDSFGLPAENYALKTGTHPRETSKRNIENYIRQMKSLALGYDFDEKVVASSPEYYKWTQWIFTKFFENDLVYKKTDFVNWCDSCKTVLANEQVENGVCERCKKEVIQKEVPGWFFKITNFADDLINGLDKLDWPKYTKKNQINWIGKSEGAEIEFIVKSEKLKNNKISNVVLVHGCPSDIKKAMNPKARTHNKGWLLWIKNELEKSGIKVNFPLMPQPWAPVYEEYKKVLDNLDINENSVLVGTSCGASFLVRWLGDTQKKIKKLILVAPWYEPNLDKRQNINFYNFEINESIKSNINEITIFTSDNEVEKGKESAKIIAEKLDAKIIGIKGYGHYQEKDMGTEEFPELLEEILRILKIKVFTTRPDTLFGATYCVLAPEHKIVNELKDSISNWSDVEKYLKDTKKKTERERVETKEKTGVELKGVKAINPANNEEIPIFIADYVLAHYGTGAIMAVPAHDPRDFEFAKKFELPIKRVIECANVQISTETGHYLSPRATSDINVHTGGGKLVNSGKFDGMENEEAKSAITKFVGGEMKTTYRLRDWSISRQRYWGTPIPMVYDPKGKAHIVPEEHLPWLLPDDVDFVPTGVAPLEKSKELHERTEKIFGKGWTPETDTMDTFVCSSWYYLRYPDPHNDEEFVSVQRLKHWLPVDLYIGGAEHTYLHLLYARFFTKAMNKIGILDFDEPFLKLRHQGLVLDSKGIKMSKSKGNVVNPDDMIERFGADATRLYTMFSGPLDDNIVWDENGVVGTYRFLEKVWKMQEKLIDANNIAINQVLHKTIKKVTEDIESLDFNTAISAMMILINTMGKEEFVDKECYEILLKLLAPFAPHISEEIWEELGYNTSVHLEKWPKYKKSLTVDENMIIAIQINGKLRDSVELPINTNEKNVREAVLAREKIQKWVQGKDLKRIIYIPEKLVNIVI